MLLFKYASRMQWIIFWYFNRIIMHTFVSYSFRLYQFFTWYKVQTMCCAHIFCLNVFALFTNLDKNMFFVTKQARKGLFCMKWIIKHMRLTRTDRLGKNPFKIIKRKMAKQCDFKNRQNCTNHSGCQAAINKMYNHHENTSPNSCNKQSRHKGTL